MKRIIAALLVAGGLLSGLCAAQDKPAAPVSMSDKDRIDTLIKQNQLLIQENIRLNTQIAKGKNSEEHFAACMQATKGQTSPMATESIGEHCEQLLRSKAPDLQGKVK